VRLPRLRRLEESEFSASREEHDISTWRNYATSLSGSDKYPRVIDVQCVHCVG
jgi:hypothetical protein